MEINNFANIKSLFFDNKTVKQTILKNTFWISLSTVIDRLLRLVLLIYAARILGPTGYGGFAFVLSFVSLFAILHDLGLPEIVVREFACRKESVEEFYSILSLKILLGLVTFFLIFLISFFLFKDYVMQKTVLILAIFSIVNGFISIFYSFFHAFQKIEYRAWIEIALATLLAGTGLGILFKFPSVINLSYAYLFSGVAVLSAVLVFFHLKFYNFKILWKKEIWKKFFLMSWPLALAGLFGVIYNYIDSVMLGFWGMITQVGWYSAAYKIVNVAILPSALLSRTFYPALSKLLKDSRADFQRVWDKQMEIMILLAVPLAIGGIVFAPQIIGKIYGERFYPSILPLQILMVGAGIIFISRPLDDAIILLNQQKKIFLITVSGAIINVILNFFLIPRYSMNGAAIAVVATNILIIAMYFWYTAKLTLARPFNRSFMLALFMAIISSIFMYFVITLDQIRNLSIFILIPTGAAAYFAALFLLKKILKNFNFLYVAEK